MDQRVHDLVAVRQLGRVGDGLVDLDVLEDVFAGEPAAFAVRVFQGDADGVVELVAAFVMFVALQGRAQGEIDGAAAFAVGLGDGDAVGPAFACLGIHRCPAAARHRPRFIDRTRAIDQERAGLAPLKARLLADLAGVVFGGVDARQLLFYIGNMVFPDVARDAEDIGRRCRDKIMAAMGTALAARHNRRILRHRAVECYLRLPRGIAGAECIPFVGENFDQLAGQMNQRLPLVRAKAAAAVIVMRIFFRASAFVLSGPARLAVHLCHLLSLFVHGADVRFQMARRDVLFRPVVAAFTSGPKHWQARAKVTEHETKDGIEVAVSMSEENCESF